MNRAIAIIGVPSSAGAHWPGQEKAPYYLRRAGLVARLEAVGLDVIDCGDLPLERFRPDGTQRRQQNLATVVRVAENVAGQVDRALQRNAIPLVIGGDCTIGLGVIAGFLRHGENPGLIYFDGHVDLNTPATSTSGILDSMGVAHMVGEPGSADELTHLGPRFPLMPEDEIVLFGYNPLEMNTPEREALTRSRLRHYPLAQVQAGPQQAASAALSYLEARTGCFVVHFDVDVIDFTELPIADVPQFSQGLLFQDVITCLVAFACSPRFGGLTITEFNPDHADEENAVVFIEALARALAGTGPA